MTMAKLSCGNFICDAIIANKLLHSQIIKNTEGMKIDHFEKYVFCEPMNIQANCGFDVQKILNE